MPLNPQAAAYLDQLRELGAPPHWEVGPAEARRLMDEAARGLFGKPDPVALVEDADADGVPVRVYRPADRELPALIWFHGGGWVPGSLASHDGARRLLDAGVPVTLTRYDGQIHGFLRMPALIDQANHALDEVAEAIRSALAVPVG